MKPSICLTLMTNDKMGALGTFCAALFVTQDIL